MKKHLNLRNLTVMMLGFIPCELSAQGIVSDNGTHIVPSGNIYITISNGGFTNNGSFLAGAGTMSFTGSSALTVTRISGAGSTSFYDLLLNKTADGLKLEQSISVSHQLLLQGGDSLYLNGYNIDLGTTGSISGETESRRITGLSGGYIQATRDLNVPASVNPGNIGIEISSAANLGTTVIRRGHHQQAGKSVFRYFEITPSNNSGLLATLKFYYFNAELASLSEANLAYFQSTNAGSTWTNLGENGIDPLGNSVTLTGVNTLNRFTLSDISQPLYVRLLYFKGTTSPHANQLYWASAAENESDYFEVQRSVNGIIYQPIGRVDASGNAVNDRFYQFMDEQYPAGAAYYRLRMADLSGKDSYSGIVMIRRETAELSTTKMWPNPASSQVKVSFVAAAEKDLIIRISDQSGKTILRTPVHCLSGENQVTIDLSRIPGGFYLLHFSDATLPDLKLIKQ